MMPSDSDNIVAAGPAPEPPAPSYGAARARFLAAAEAVGATVTSEPHPDTGLHGDDLWLDVATLGPAGAPHRTLLVSGTHGVEGFLGSALQSHWLEHHAARRPAGTRLVLLHALNPYGFSWVRRVNEDNIDLNRNFIDWQQPPPPNPDYSGLAELLVPVEFDDDTIARTSDELTAFAMEVGFERMQEIVSAGQYDHPDGVFFGGHQRAWSNERLSDVWAEQLDGAATVTVLDLHTGLGPWGHGELISHEPIADPGYDRATRRWGEVRSMLDGESVSAALSGDWLGHIDVWAGATEVTACALEFGTVDTITVLQALRHDAWLHAHGDPAGERGDQVRAQVRAAFIDDDPAWIDTCWQRLAPLLDAALRPDPD